MGVLKEIKLGDKKGSDTSKLRTKLQNLEKTRNRLNEGMEYIKNPLQDKKVKDVGLEVLKPRSHGNKDNETG